MDSAAKEGARCKDDFIRGDLLPVVVYKNSIALTISETQVADTSLNDSKVANSFAVDEREIANDRRLHIGLVDVTVDLNSWALHCGSLRLIQHFELNCAQVSELSHEAAKSVDLANECALANTTYAGIAAHLTNRFFALCDQQCLDSCSGRGVGCLTAGMASTDHYHLCVSCRHLWFK